MQPGDHIPIPRDDRGRRVDDGVFDGIRRRPIPGPEIVDALDTNSEVENGEGLLLSLSAGLSVQTPVTLPGPRDVQVRALRCLPDGRLVIAGMRDGPLTHTDVTMTNNDGFWGIARLSP